MKYKKAAEFLSMPVLPAGVNDEAIKKAREYKDAGLMAAIEHVIKHREFGEVTHLDVSGTPVVIFNFMAGVCTRMNPIMWVDARNVFKGSVKFYE
jgi:hypothetical protein